MLILQRYQRNTTINSSHPSFIRFLFHGSCLTSIYLDPLQSTYNLVTQLNNFLYMFYCKLASRAKRLRGILFVCTFPVQIMLFIISASINFSARGQYNQLNPSHEMSGPVLKFETDSWIIVTVNLSGIIGTIIFIYLYLILN